MKIKLIKAQTNGNDFIIMPNIELNNEIITIICDRHYGIGCDQLIMFKQINSNTFDLKFYNNDGSIANMCGNGSCAFALFVNKYINKNIKELYINVSQSNTNINKYIAIINNNKVSIKFPMPYYINNDIICTGNYHKVYSIEEINIVEKIQKQYPECNIHFIKKINEDITNKYPDGDLKYVRCNNTGIYSNDSKCNVKNVPDNNTKIYNQYYKNNSYDKEDVKSIVKVITYERGAGRTLACGSGAIAIAFYLSKNIILLHEGGTSIVHLYKDSIELTTEPKIGAECIMDI